MEATLSTLLVSSDAPALAQALAQRVVADAQAAIGARGRFVLVLAGGSTPRAAYELLAQDPLRSAIDWTRVDVFFGDERCVPPSSDQSNFRMASETLLEHVPVPPGNIHRMLAEQEPHAAAVSYTETIAAVLGPTPRFDLVLLGLGPDAHTASWFPHVALDEERWVDAPYVPKFATHRLTLTPPLINAARAIVVATSGAEKAEALAHVLSPTRDLAAYPAQRLNPTSGTLTWLVDEAATALLSSSSASVG